MIILLKPLATKLAHPMQFLSKKAFTFLLLPFALKSCSSLEGNFGRTGHVNVIIGFRPFNL